MIRTLHQEMRSGLVDSIHSADRDVSSKYMYHYQSPISVAASLTSEICATVPQFCGPLLTPSGVNGHAGASAPDMCIGEDTHANGVPVTACVYHLLWLLLSAGQATQSDSQRDWIIQQCRYIGRATGI